MAHAAQANYLYSELPNLAGAGSRALMNAAREATVSRPASAVQQRKLVLVQPSLAFHPAIPSLSPSSAISATAPDDLSNGAGSVEQYLWAASWFLLGLLFLCTT